MYKYDWEKKWDKLDSGETLKEGDHQRYVLAFRDESPSPIQNQLIGTPVGYRSSFHYYRAKVTS